MTIDEDIARGFWKDIFTFVVVLFKKPKPSSELKTSPHPFFLITSSGDRETCSQCYGCTRFKDESCDKCGGFGHVEKSHEP